MKEEALASAAALFGSTGVRFTFESWSPEQLLLHPRSEASKAGGPVGAEGSAAPATVVLRLCARGKRTR